MGEVDAAEEGDVCGSKRRREQTEERGEVVLAEADVNMGGGNVPDVEEERAGGFGEMGGFGGGGDVEAGYELGGVGGGEVSKRVLGFN